MPLPNLLALNQGEPLRSQVGLSLWETDRTHQFSAPRYPCKKQGSSLWKIVGHPPHDTYQPHSDIQSVQILISLSLFLFGTLIEQIGLLRGWKPRQDAGSVTHHVSK